MFRRLRYPLPKFPENVVAAFHQLCEEIPVPLIPQLREELSIAIKGMREEFAKEKYADATTLSYLYKTSLMLLDQYGDRTAKERALIIGAIRYFTAEEDPLSDTQFASGLLDDVRVMNHVLEQLAIDDAYIELPQRF